MAQSICFYFQVHQPYRIAQHSLVKPDEGDIDYFADGAPFTNEQIFEKVAHKCYIPMTNLLLDMLYKHPEFHISFSLSGVFIEQCLEFGKIGKQVLDKFKALARTGQVEFLGETYYHSLSFLYSKAEFAEQVFHHHQLIKEHFHQSPKVFRNTELIYNNELATCIHALGFQGIIAEGWHTALPDQHPNTLRHAHLIELDRASKKIMHDRAFRDWTGVRRLKNDALPVLTKNYTLSDDMAFRFGDKNWSHHPLHADTYMNWIKDAPGETINLFMDFETFGEHQWEDTGIFKFFEALPDQAKRCGVGFKTPSQTIQTYNAEGVYSTPHWVSWADEDRDISAWIENDMQRSAYNAIDRMEKKLFKYKDSKKMVWKKLWDDFRKLQTSDHLYYMSTKYWADGDVHAYFSPYPSPYDAYINFMNVFEHLKARVDKLTKKK